MSSSNNFIRNSESTALNSVNVDIAPFPPPNYTFPLPLSATRTSFPFQYVAAVSPKQHVIAAIPLQSQFVGLNPPNYDCVVAGTSLDTPRISETILYQQVNIN